jgi:phospholipase/carboxylesterase
MINAALDPHRDQPVVHAGLPLEQARAALILLHGRGGDAPGILTLSTTLDCPGFAFLAPQAAGYTWYPRRFLVPQADNQPWLDSALAAVQRVLDQVHSAGIPAERTLLLGFSQGACLALEFAARRSPRLGGVAGLSGGLIGLEGELITIGGNERLVGMPVFLGCSDIDPHIPLRRVQLTAQTLLSAGALVDLRLYPGMGHEICEDELEAVRGMLATVV